MTYSWIPPKRALHLVPGAVIPTPETLDLCIAGLTKQLKRCRDKDKRWRLKEIKKEVEYLRDAL